MNKTKIEWCDSTWNPVTGCLHGCEYCYARKIAERFGAHLMPISGKQTVVLEKQDRFVIGKNIDVRACPYPFDFLPTFHRYLLDEPARWTKPRTIFVCSMADLFGEWVPDVWIMQVFDACMSAPQHRYLFLTKNPKRIDTAIDDFSVEDRGSQECYDWFNGFWFGTSVTCEADTGRIPEIEKIEEGNRFLSVEPLLGPIELKLERNRCPVCGSNFVFHENPVTSKGRPPVYCDACGEYESETGEDLKPSINWVILGAETGNRKGKIVPEKAWIDDIVSVCKAAGVPVFMKDSLIPIIGEQNMIREFPWRTEA